MKKFCIAILAILAVSSFTFAAPCRGNSCGGNFGGNCGGFYGNNCGGNYQNGCNGGNCPVNYGPSYGVPQANYGHQIGEVYDVQVTGYGIDGKIWPGKTYQESFAAYMQSKNSTTIATYPPEKHQPGDVWIADKDGILRKASPEVQKKLQVK